MKREQFEETMGTLKTFASTKYVSSIDYLTPIFVDLSQPVLLKPKFPNIETEVTVKDDTKLKQNSFSREDLYEYCLQLKEIIKD